MAQFPQPTRPHQRPTRSEGPGGIGGCAQKCTNNQVCSLNFQQVVNGQSCLSLARAHQFPLPSQCYQCQSPGPIHPYTRPTGMPTRPQWPPRTPPSHGYTRPHVPGSRPSMLSCSRFQMRGSPPITSASTCYSFCQEHEGANSSWTGDAPAICTCTTSYGRSFSCAYTQPTPATGGASCDIGSTTWNECLTPVSILTTACSAVVANQNNCNPFAPPNSSAFHDCDAVYSCMTREWQSNSYKQHLPAFGTCCPCVKELGRIAPGDQWMDEINCPTSPNADGDDDDKDDSY